MTNVPLHPALVHVPLGLAFAIPAVAAAIAFALWRGRVTRRAWSVVVLLQALLVAGGALALRTGEADQKRIERLVGEQPVETHEEAAEAFLWAAGLALALSAATLAVPGRATRVAASMALAGTFVVAALGYRTGKAGGELVYARGAAAAWAAPASGAPVARAASSGGHERDDD